MQTEENSKELEETVINSNNVGKSGGKRQMSQKQIDALGLAREKAWAKRKQLGDISSKEKELEKKMKMIALKKRQQKVEKKLEKLMKNEEDDNSSFDEKESSSSSSSSNQELGADANKSNNRNRNNNRNNNRNRNTNNRSNKVQDQDQDQDYKDFKQFKDFKDSKTLPEQVSNNNNTPNQTSINQDLSIDVAREMLKNKILKESRGKAFESLFPGVKNPFIN